MDILKFVISRVFDLRIMFLLTIWGVTLLSLKWYPSMVGTPIWLLPSFTTLGMGLSIVLNPAGSHIDDWDM
jgi:hypothetical protein